METVTRQANLDRLATAVAARPVVGLIGPRQCGKTWLARRFIEAHYPGLPSGNFLDLESLRDLARLENPLLALESLSGLVVLDEVQRKPEIFQTLRVLADRPERKNRFLVLEAPQVSS
jgi:predicted AAA+ superfamily ATPase